MKRESVTALYLLIVTLNTQVNVFCHLLLPQNFLHMVEATCL